LGLMPSALTSGEKTKKNQKKKQKTLNHTISNPCHFQRQLLGGRQTASQQALHPPLLIVLFFPELRRLFHRFGRSGENKVNIYGY
jgi:hypothetical protein